MVLNVVVNSLGILPEMQENEENNRFETHIQEQNQMILDKSIDGNKPRESVASSTAIYNNSLTPNKTMDTQKLNSKGKHQSPAAMILNSSSLLTPNTTMDTQKLSQKGIHQSTETLSKDDTRSTSTNKKSRFFFPMKISETKKLNISKFVPAATKNHHQEKKHKEHLVLMISELISSCAKIDIASFELSQFLRKKLKENVYEIFVSLEASGELREIVQNSIEMKFRHESENMSLSDMVINEMFYFESNQST